MKHFSFNETIKDVIMSLLQLPNHIESQHRDIARNRDEFKIERDIAS